MTLFAALATPVQLAAQQSQSKQFPHYSVTDLGTLGGKFAIALAINNRGLTFKKSIRRTLMKRKTLFATLAAIALATTLLGTVPSALAQQCSLAGGAGGDAIH